MTTLRRAALAGAVLLAATALAGCGGGDDDAAPASTGAAGTAAGGFDRSFIDAMVPHHRSAIAMAKEAKAAGLQQPELRRIADDIVEAQQREIEQLLDWREAWFGSRTIEPGAAAGLGLTDEEAGMMEHGEAGIAGAQDVDRAFAAAMIPHHEGAIRMAELALERAEHDELRELARQIVEAQQREIEELRPHAAGMHHG